MKKPPFLSTMKTYAPFLPYLATLIGLYVFKNAWLVLIIYHLGILLILVKEKKLSLLKDLIKGWNNRFGILFILFGLAAGFFLFSLWIPLEVRSFSPTMTAFGLTGISFTIWTLYFFLLNPFFEEVFWRGYLHADSPHVIVNDILFAGYHLLVLAFFMPWYSMIACFIGIVTAAFLWRQLRRKYCGLLMPAASHLAADISIMIAAGMHLM